MDAYLEHAKLFFMTVTSEGMFFVLLLLFTIHGAVLGYHWFTYGTHREVSMVALATYLIGGAILFLTLSLTLNAI